MKALCAIAIAMFLCTAADCAAGPFRVSWSAANVGFTFNMPDPEHEVKCGEITMGLGNILIQHQWTGIVLELETVKFSLLFYEAPGDTAVKLHFINPSIYWNSLMFFPVPFLNHFFFGPVVSLNYLAVEGVDPFLYFPNSSVEPEWNFEDVDTRIGTRFLYTPAFKKSYFLPFSAGSEFGYRILPDENGLYLAFLLRMSI